MLPCHACLRRHLLAFLPEETHRAAQLASRGSVPPLLSRPGVRHASEAARGAFVTTRERPKYEHSRKPPSGDLSGPRVRPSKPLSRPTTAVANAGDRALSERELREELKYLADPLKLADNTRRLLRQDDFPKALEMVRLAGRTLKVTVSWNHLIDHAIGRGRVAEAVKMFNEMKKRAQPPDSYTYMLLLRGLGQHASFGRSLERALSIYHSMSAPNSPVRPTVLHTNAVLKVAALRNDVDTMFGIAADLPSRGSKAADHWTFTTILNALRVNAIKNTSEFPHYSAEELNGIKLNAVMQGKRIWADIVGRWRDGDMRVDEELVCAMGRLLVISPVPTDWECVLWLAEQTMGMERLGKLRRSDATRAQDVLDASEQAKRWRLAQPRGESEGKEKKMEDVEAAVAVGDRNDVEERPELRYDPDRILRREQMEEGLSTVVHRDDDFIELVSKDLASDLEGDQSEYDSTRSRHTTPPDPSFAPLQDRKLAVLAQPSRSTLSLVLDASFRCWDLAAARGYWTLLTANDGPFRISPDRDNYNAYFRTIRVSRASRLAVDLVTDMLTSPKDGGSGVGASGKTFDMAMRTCVRDSKNPRVLDHAIRILNMMSGTLDMHDVSTGHAFLDLLFKTKNDSRAQIRGMKAFDTTIHNLKTSIAYGVWDLKGEGQEGGSPGGAAAPAAAGTAPSEDDDPADDAKFTRPKPQLQKQILALISRYIQHTQRILDMHGADMSVPERRECHDRKMSLISWSKRNSFTIRIGNKVEGERLAKEFELRARRQDEEGEDDGRAGLGRADVGVDLEHAEVEPRRRKVARAALEVNL